MFIQCKAFFRDDITDDVWDNLSEQQRFERCHTRPFRFESTELVCYNESSNPLMNGNTTIRFKNGYDIIINMKYTELDRILQTI